MAVRQFKMLAAAMSAVVVMAMAFTLSCTSDDDDDGGVTKGTFTDSRDGKTYKTIQFNIQTWFAENLNYDVEGSKCYNNSTDSCAKYGRLYDWPAAMTACPSGWHLPSSGDWRKLLQPAVGGFPMAGRELKATSFGGTDAYGFTALPGGYGDSAGGFWYAGSYGYWWTATPFDNITYSSPYFWYIEMRFNREGVGIQEYYHASYLLSVRCVQNGQLTITFDANGGTVSPTSAKTDEDGKLESLPTPTMEGHTFYGWYTAQTGGTKVSDSRVFTANTRIYARWAGTQTISTFTDSRDGKTYKKVVILEQTWMAENLNYDAPGSVCYRYDPANCEMYGRLYDWETAMTACPVGWSLPSDADWTTLTDFFGGESTAGTKLKSMDGWNEYGNGTWDYGFAALPGGVQSSGGGGFSSAGNIGFWWSSTEYDASKAWFRRMQSYENDVYRYNISKTFLHTVRCVED
jgi:uncharacterized protein (TIGR02145 family)/uncharacterized repeat protein (TIGR02543 family)